MTIPAINEQSELINKITKLIVEQGTKEQYTFKIKNNDFIDFAKSSGKINSVTKKNNYNNYNNVYFIPKSEVPAIKINNSLQLLETPAKYLDGFYDLLAKQLRRYISLLYDPKTAAKKAFLWVATKKGCAPIYIFGSIHLINPMLRDYFEDVLKLYVKEVTTVFTEVVPNGALITLDGFVYEFARQTGKNCKTLEDDEVRAKIYNEKPGNSAKNIIFTFTKALFSKYIQKTPPDNPDLVIFLENYLTHISKSDCFGWDNHVVLRNIYWMKAILAESQSQNQNPALVVCGGDHNYGRYGLPSLLQMEGYKLQPLIDKCPMPRSSIVRILAGLEGNFTFFNKPQVYEVKNENLGKENPCRDIVPYGSI